LFKFALEAAPSELTPTPFYKEVAINQNLENVASQIAAEDSLIWEGIDTRLGEFALKYTTKLLGHFYSVEFRFALKRNRTAPYLEEITDPKQYYLYQVALVPDLKGQQKVIDAVLNAYKLRDTDPRIASAIAKSLNAIGYSDAGQEFSNLAVTQTFQGLNRMLDIIKAQAEHEQEEVELSRKVRELLVSKYRTFKIDSPRLYIRPLHAPKYGNFPQPNAASCPFLFFSSENALSFSENMSEGSRDVFYSANNDVVINDLGRGAFTASSDDLARRAWMEKAFFSAVNVIHSVRSQTGNRDQQLKDAADVFNSGKSGDQAAIQQPQSPVDPSQSVLPKQTFYSVTNIAQDDTLNVRSGPGVSYDLVARLPNNSSGIRILGEPVLNGMTEWVQIVFDNRTGWVVKSYLKPE
jgi:hypothetical protein